MGEEREYLGKVKEPQSLQGKRQRSNFGQGTLECRDTGSERLSKLRIGEPWRFEQENPTSKSVLINGFNSHN